MFGMSQEQVLGLIRHVVSSVGTLLIMIGLTSAETVGAVTAIILNLAGPLMIFGALGWSMVNKTTAALVGQVDAIAKDPGSPVQAVITTNTPEGHELANSLPGTTTVTAGTTAAAAAKRSVT